MSPRRFFSAMRRLFDPFDGRVGRRLRAGGAIASATRALSLASAAERLRSWDRCSEAATVSTPSTSRPDRRCTARSRRVGERTGEAARSQDSSTRESVVLTDCPPGPLDRENRQRNSPSGITTEGRTCRSPGTPPASLTAGTGSGRRCQDRLVRGFHVPDHAAVLARSDVTSATLRPGAPPILVSVRAAHDGESLDAVRRPVGLGVSCRIVTLAHTLSRAVHRAAFPDFRRILPVVQGTRVRFALGRSGGTTAGVRAPARRPWGEAA